MDECLKEIIEKESKNYNKIYLYLNSELKQYSAYEFSAYLLVRMFHMLELKGITDEEGDRVVSVSVPVSFVIEQFSGLNVMVSDKFVRVSIDELKLCLQWKADFNELKRMGLSGK